MALDLEIIKKKEELISKVHDFLIERGEDPMKQKEKSDQTSQRMKRSN